eukprot:TRINITY_DN1162_c0_g3_i1.p1 TRINITY_DN1162_c0_g3~~TRINITY_DN1162_c0_g3_i1.p1  ORF type:complete len:901 (-),score=162.04 TRINITY_DN1162_c0_g3_i1:195-2897(-)
MGGSSSCCSPRTIPETVHDIDCKGGGPCPASAESEVMAPGTQITTKDESQNRGHDRRGNRARIGNDSGNEGAPAEENLALHRRSREKGVGTTELIKEGIKHESICALLEEFEYEAIIESMEYFTFAKGEFIVEQGNVGSTFFVSHSGTLEVSVDKKVCNTLSKGSAFGGLALIYNCPRTATVVAVDDSSVWGANGATFHRVLRENCQKHFASNRVVLDSIHLFDGLNDQQKNAVCEAVFMQVLKAKTRMVTQGEAPAGVYFVKRGNLSVMENANVNANGEVIGGKEIGKLGPGDCYGERALLNNKPQTATVVATGNCEILCISTDGLTEALGNSLSSCLHKNLVLSALEQSPIFANIQRAQRIAVTREMITQSYPPNAQIDTSLRFVVLLEGAITGTIRGTERKWDHCGDFYEPKGSDSKDALTAGKNGATLSVLSTKGFSKVSALLGCSSSTTEDVAVYARKSALVKKAPIFRHLSQEQTSKLVPVLVQHKYKKGESIIKQGEAGSSFFVIASGEVTVSLDGKVIRTMGKNAYFGERALLFDEPRTATISVSSSEAELWSIDKEPFTQVVKGNMREELMHRINLQDTNVTLKDVKHIRVVGQGATGVVRLVEHKKTKTRYALKRVCKTAGKIPPEVKRECDLLAANDHPFIMKLVKTFETKKNVYMLTELITGGELHSAIRQIPRVLSQTQARFYTGSLIIILEELADRRILYRDLKPENVMLDHQGYLKLIDFGIAKQLREGDTRTFTMVGTPHYMAPEVMRGQGYSTPVDLWSLGVLLFEFVCGPLPFANDLDDPTEVFTAVMRLPLKFPDMYKDMEGKEVIQGLLCRNVKKRMGAGPNGFDDLRGAQYFKAETGKPSLFDRIMGRELTPPWVPRKETYCEEQEIRSIVLSDADELG